MGTAFSRFRLAYQTLNSLSETYAKLSDRLSLTPGIPIPNPSTPYWTVPPAPIARHGAEDGSQLPEYADVVIIGSGITGAAIARMLLDYDDEHGRSERPLKVVMLEARDACSGGTARNGGHITPPLYHDYAQLKKDFGMEAAKKIIRFRLSHLSTFLSVAKEEGLILESQCRELQTFDVFFDEGMFRNCKEKLATYSKDMPVESKSYRIYEQQECQKLQLSSRVVGCLSTRAGAMHPYHFVTGILSRLLGDYPKNFQLFTHTPCTSITSSSQYYSLTTPKGTLKTLRVIHATNAWSSHLIPGMRKKIVPVRGNMSAQRPGRGLGKISDYKDGANSWLGMRSFVFYPSTSGLAFDYLTQLKSDSTSAGEMMFGGGYTQGGLSERAFFEEVGNVNDGGWNLGVAGHLGGALGVYFGQAWGEEGRDKDGGKHPEQDGSNWDKGRVKAVWSGIEGISADALPWVGKLPEKVAGRKIPRGRGFIEETESTGMAKSPFEKEGSFGFGCSDISKPDLSLPVPKKDDPLPPNTVGEWISAGYSGEGMVHAWMSGTAVAYMLLGLDSKRKGGSGSDLEQWFPEAFRITEKRWKNARVEDMLGRFEV